MCLHRRTVVPAGAVACGRRQAGPSAAVSPPTCCRSFGKCRAPAKKSFNAIAGHFVRVEHVHVNDGEGAVIGNVKKEDAKN